MKRKKQMQNLTLIGTIKDIPNATLNSYREVCVMEYVGRLFTCQKIFYINDSVGLIELNLN